MNLGLELFNDSVVRVDLEGLLRLHVGRHGRVTESLSLHDSLHVGGPTELTGNEDARGRIDTVGNGNLLDLLSEDVLHGSGEVLEFLRLLLTGSLLLIGLLEFESVLGDANELLVLELLELGSGVLVDGVDHEENFEVLLLEDLEERRVANLGEGFASDVVDVLLLFGHAGDVVLERGHLFSRLGRVESEELGELGTVLSVLVDTELEVLAESLVELGEAVMTPKGSISFEGLLLDQTRQ